MIFGVDFDNTIVCYDGVFREAAIEQGLIPEDGPESKFAIRDHLVQRDMEDAWTELQGHVYGPGMKIAKPYEDVIETFASALASGVKIHVISHRTRTPFLGPAHDLHEAARQWLDAHGFFSRTGLDEADVFFELTADEKVHRVCTQRCDWFIDDLPEFLSREGFPEALEKLLFDPHDNHAANYRFARVASWSAVRDVIPLDGATPK